jgi:hypothetical protein
MRAALLCVLTTCVLPSCMPLSLPTAKQEPTKAERAATAPTIKGMTVDAVRACFPGFTFVESEDETAYIHTGVQKLGESSATVNVLSYAPDAVASVHVVVNRPGSASGPLLDRLMAEYLPLVLAALYDGADEAAAREWLNETLLTLSATDHRETTIGGVTLFVNTLRSKSSIKLTPVAPPRPAGT